MAKFSVKRRLKRKFIGNRHTVNAPTVGHVDGDVSASAAKLVNLDDNCEVPMPDPLLQGNRIIDMEILSSVFAMLACPECKNTSLSLEERSQHGISFSYAVVCGACAYVHSFESSKKTGSSIENNLRLVYAMRQLGKGHSGAVTLAKVMNMPPPPWHSAYQKISAKLCYLKTLGNLAARNRQNLSATQVGRNNDEEAAPTSETKETAEGDTDTNKTTSTATSSLNNREGAHQKSTDMECDQKVVGKKPREITKEGRTPDEVCAEEAPPKTQILRWPSMKLKHKVPIDRRMAPPADLPEGVVLTADFATERY
ncbi:hypothetical protein HPB51_013390 [Rhipicephalus microplus]|uniref:Mutator-like transposase domain-containing protein n=1 Tax=Rhipicephalus microplus TaxID=6941 RepID=A0A9J6EGA6_RHIMP|nr:hypothetical protein HPB51_013390 [Rhipicephalus microplus]